MFLYIYLATGKGQTTPWGQNFYININLFQLVIVSSIKWLSNSFPHIKAIWPYCKIGQGQPKVIIWTNYDGPKAPMPSQKVIGLLVLEKKIFEVFLPYMGMVAILVPDPDCANKLSFPHPTEALYEIWLWPAQRFWRSLNYPLNSEYFHWICPVQLVCE